jgi:NADPH:quinone reductase-like Zn-dependent oxidoreductase
VAFGTSVGPTGPIPLQALYRSALRILGYGGLRDSDEILGATLATALSALADGRLDVAIGKTLPLSQVNEAFELLAARKVRGEAGTRAARMIHGRAAARAAGTSHATSGAEARNGWSSSS